MSSQDNGGQAFPCENIVERDVRGCLHGPDISSAGMTMRDYFAAKAMQAAFTGSVVNKELDDRHVIAKVAYLLADAMLEARK